MLCELHSKFSNYSSKPSVYIPDLASTNTPSPAVSTLIAVVGAASNRTNRLVLSSVGGVGVSISLADTPEIASSVLAIVGGIVLSPLLAIHGTIDSLGLILVTKNVDHDLVADIWISSLGRVTGVVSGLSGASRCACRHTLVVALDLRETEEFVAHIRIGVGD